MDTNNNINENFFQNNEPGTATQDQKIENILNLALSVPVSQRERTFDLNTGYDSEDNIWEIIVKYNGNLDNLVNMGITVTRLTGGYAILELPQPLIDVIADLPEIEYIEKPKQLFFELRSAKDVSCFNELTGVGTIVAVIDSGADYAHPDFINEDGTSRILYLWDQTIDGTPPEGYNTGSEYTRAQLNSALEAPNIQERLSIVPSVDTSGHGTHVLGIAAGNGRASAGRYRGCAPESDIIVVKLGNARTGSFALTTGLMQGINYVIQKALEVGRPVAVNISYGNSYGSHSGTSLLENFIDNISGLWKNLIVIGTGNEGTSGHHVSGKLENQNTNPVNIQLAVYEYTPSFSIQIWKNYYDDFGIAITAPDGSSSGIIPQTPGTRTFRVRDAELLVFYGEPTPYSVNQEIYIELIPSGNFFDSGVWNISLYPYQIVNGSYDIWLPAGAALNTGTRFLSPTVNTTLTIPSTSRKAMSVGAYDSYTDQLAPFSGRGYTRNSVIKPEIVAPGVDIMSAAPGGGYTTLSGTSMATPFVTGATACLMQWGITDGNDPYLYGEKAKAYLISGARKLPGFTEWPNPQVGDCVKLVLG